jgi:lysophospholipase L1-like esterase
MLRIFFLIFLVLIILEVILNSISPSVYESDKTLGWKLKKNFSHQFKKQSLKKKDYSANFITNKHGMIEYDNINNPNKTILVIGDSYSTDPNVGNESFWYTIMKKKLEKELNIKINIFASGGGGYGSTQEYLAFKQALQSVKPDFLILQFCINDFQNNLLEWEKKNFNFNQYLRRPYIDNNGNIYTEKNFIGYVPNIISTSRLFNIFLSRLGNFLSNVFPLDLNSKEMQNIKDNSIKITKKNLEKIYFTDNKIKKIIVNCKEPDGIPETHWSKISKEIGFEVLVNNTKDIENAKYKDIDIYNSDGGHYNIIGNEIFGLSIANEIIAKKILSGY